MRKSVASLSPWFPIQTTQEQVRSLLVRWLFLCPLQRTEDLVLALAPWRSRATVLRLLATLQAQGLVESLCPGLGGGKRFYHLTPTGMAWYAAHRGHDTLSSPLPPSTSQGARAELLRLLSRIPALVPVQNAVNGLVAGAAEALTRQGHRATLVQWDWQRNAAHPFTYRDRMLHLRADGICSWRLHFGFPGAHDSQDPHHSQEAEGEQQQCWVTVLLLHLPGDDAALMRVRLDRLMRWRESPERWPVYHRMPPVLVLATTTRQAEWWHRAALQVAAHMQGEVLVGAVIVLPPTHDAAFSPWHVPWRTLGTKQSCHLRDLLPFHAHPAFRVRFNPTPVLFRHQPAEEAAQIRHTGLRRRTYQLSAQAQHLKASIPHTARELRLLSLNLVPRHLGIIHVLLKHPLLSAENLAAFLAFQEASIEKYLTQLRHMGLIEPVETVVGTRWQLAEPGLRLLAETLWCHVRHLAVFPEDLALPLGQRGVPGLLQHISHTAGIYGFFADLARHLGNALHWWETGASCERFFRVQQHTYRFRPDALAECQTATHALRFWLEWDRGTMNARDLRQKFRTYGAYLRTRAWAQEHPILPALLCVTPESRQEHLLIRIAQETLPATPALPLFTTTASHLTMAGVLAPVWWQTRPGQCSPPEENRRRVLFTLPPAEGDFAAESRKN